MRLYSSQIIPIITDNKMCTSILSFHTQYSESYKSINKQ